MKISYTQKIQHYLLQNSFQFGWGEALSPEHAQHLRKDLVHR
jgi:hypothetical protein